MSNVALAGSPPKSTRGDRDLSTVAEQRTEPSTPARSASPKSTAAAPASAPAHEDMPDHSHQCRECRASFCQPLSCGHMYCDECLPPPRLSGCPECRRQSIANRPPVQPSQPSQPVPQPEPKSNHDIERDTTFNPPGDKRHHNTLKYIAAILTIWLLLEVVVLTLAIFVLRGRITNSAAPWNRD
ncbi:hypothetical protein CkaCkLH20_01575 [Colletotrichum karsti]|uniref:RING-type domain-containing protein n=1 Tax=Colletotrichum karsti TaxID=1095194 RepID=A0A9P6ICX5_9PEZI|nr:uncharacterized protein CkaCkLH20_01575 [Colletotrichum karsti]KAF9880533.1 hypothetical protein CkaCkLH20_01575 [Colletotrichum karsti]